MHPGTTELFGEDRVFDLLASADGPLALELASGNNPSSQLGVVTVKEDEQGGATLHFQRGFFLLI